MIKFTIGKENYSIEKIKVKDLYKIKEMQWFDGTNAAAGIVSYLSGCPEEDIKKLKPYQFIPLWNQVQELFAVKEENPVHTEIKINGNHYGLLHMDEITVGEIADAELIMHRSDADYKTHELLAILYRPVTGYWGTTYSIEEYDSKKAQARAVDFLELDLDVMRGATAFFLSFADHCTRTIVDSLRQEMKKSPARVKQLQETLLKLLEHGQTYSTSARENLLSNLNEQLDSMLEQPLTSSLENEMKQND
jgi:hypothetical protein